MHYGAKGWKTTRRVVARLVATTLGLDIRFVVTSLPGTAEHLYETVYCARGQPPGTSSRADRTSCRSALANQFRLILHTAAYWLLHTLRAAAPKASAWARAEFNTLRLGLIKLAARAVEGAARIRVWVPTVCLQAALFRLLADRFADAPLRSRARVPPNPSRNLQPPHNPDPALAMTPAPSPACRSCWRQHSDHAGRLQSFVDLASQAAPTFLTASNQPAVRQTISMPPFSAAC